MSLRLHGDTLAGRGELDFAVNLWPAPRPRGLELALEDALRGTGYPSEHEARAALARRHGRTPGEVLLANGACELFWLVAHALRSARATCVQPSFTEPEAALASVGAAVTRVQREPEGWTFEPADVPADAEIVVVGNPNNPTGGLDSRDRLLELVRPGRLVVVDESFMDFTDGRESLAGASLPGLLVVRSLTKLWSLAGIRAGYALGDPNLVALLASRRQPWSVNAVACAALAWCAGDDETPARVAAEVAAARDELAGSLARLGVRVWPSAANFLLLHVVDGPGVVAGLRERGIAVRPAASFPGLDDHFVRVAVRGRPDDDALVAALAEVL